jgi:hypothetical protein
LPSPSGLLLLLLNNALLLLLLLNNALLLLLLLNGTGLLLNGTGLLLNGTGLLLDGTGLLLDGTRLLLDGTRLLLNCTGLLLLDGTRLLLSGTSTGLLLGGAGRTCAGRLGISTDLSNYAGHANHEASHCSTGQASQHQNQTILGVHKIPLSMNFSQAHEGH